MEMRLNIPPLSLQARQQATKKKSLQSTRVHGSKVPSQGPWKNLDVEVGRLGFRHPESRDQPHISQHEEEEQSETRKL
jgi:hypothetical protein